MGDIKGEEKVVETGDEMEVKKGDKKGGEKGGENEVENEVRIRR